MIGMVRKDRCGPEQLFCKHCTDQQMRPRRRTKGQEQVGLLALVLIMSVGGTYEETNLTLSAVAPPLELLCELHRRKRITTLVEHDGYAIGLLVGSLAAAIRQLRKPGWPGNTCQIAFDEFGFRRAADLSARNDVQKQSSAGRWRSGFRTAR